MQKVNSPKLENTLRLEKLYKYLNYEISSSILFIGSWFIPIFIPILFLAAIGFTPYILYVLYKERRNGWLLTFILMVLLPVVMLLIFAYHYFVFSLIPFYLYCFLLRFEAKGWLTEMRARNDLVLQKIRKANESNELDDWIVMR
ncbi:MAG: hypothetical protein L3J41_16365 [Melioribacteraceae bacterium]|nr:hypothetical protein [Melioribacteraceae bacterium]